MSCTRLLCFLWYAMVRIVIGFVVGSAACQREERHCIQILSPLELVFEVYTTAFVLLARILVLFHSS